MHNKPVYLKTTHSVLCLAHEATRQAHSHVTSTRGELSKQIIAFLHKLVTMHTRLPLQKKDERPCSPRRQKIFTCSSVHSFRSPWLCQSGSVFARDMSLIPKRQGFFWGGWEEVKSIVPVTRHKIAISKTNASSTWEGGRERAWWSNNIRSIYFPCHMLLAHFFNNLHSLFSCYCTFWFHHYRELCSYFYIDMTLFKTMLRWNGETKEVKWENMSQKFFCLHFWFMLLQWIVSFPSK